MKPARCVPVLMYHHVSPAPGLVTVTPEHFAEQMRGLVIAGYRTLRADEFAAWLSGVPLPDKSVLLTFDDGYLDNWVYAHPVLQTLGLKAMMFVVTDWIKDGPARTNAGETEHGALPTTPAHNACKAAIATGHADEVIVRWSEIDAMRTADTFEFHSHTHAHVRWDKVCPNFATKHDGLANDLAKARATLENRLGSVSDHLCWPQGYFDDDYIAVAKAAGFRYLHTTRAGTNCHGSAPDLIHRIVVKDKSAFWLNSRLWLYRQPRLAAWYARGR
jgi:peptidoglycan/xylan/chitin deacetylase (PgdA/CDA1 family)